MIRFNFIRTICFLFCVFTLSLFSQGDKIQIDTEIRKVSEEVYDIVFNFEIEEEWRLYSQYSPKNASSPLKFSISEEDSAKLMLISFAEEEEALKEYSQERGGDQFFFKDETTVIQRIQLLDLDVKGFTINVIGEVCSESCIDLNKDFIFKLDDKASSIVTNESLFPLNQSTKNLNNNSLKLQLKDKHLLFSDGTGSENGEKSLFKIFLFGLVGGLLAFFRPSVFPLVLLTVSFFTKQDTEGKSIFNAILYGLFIVIIYILLSLPFHFIDSLSPEILNTISTTVLLNLFFFVILTLFASSFFGFDELLLPSSWGGKINTVSKIGGIVGMFFLALTLAIVSFRCTEPILGSLLAAGSLKEGAWALSAGMAGFGLSLAFPFALLALFPILLNKLPKSGRLMIAIKIVAGFIAVLLAFKFLSIADLVGGWNLFYREIFIGCWLLILLVFILFLFGLFRFSGNNKKVKILSGIRIVFGLFATAFFIYLVPGLMEKPIWRQTLLSGFAPPENYSIYKSTNECSLNLNCFKDYDKGVAYAKENNLPVLLYFTGWGCINCRNMEEKVWVDPQIYSMLNEVVLISLYVDDHNNKLPYEKQFDYVKSNAKKKRIDTYGGKWATMQIENFKTTSLPYYVIMSPDLRVLNVRQQFCSKEIFRSWLKGGLDLFNGVSDNDEDKYFDRSSSADEEVGGSSDVVEDEILDEDSVEDDEE